MTTLKSTQIQLKQHKINSKSTQKIHKNCPNPQKRRLYNKRRLKTTEFDQNSHFRAQITAHKQRL